MRDTVDKVLKQAKDYFSGLGKKERRRLIILAAFVVTLSVAAAVLLSQTTWVVLEAGLDPASASKYASALTEIGIRYKLTDGGTAVLVPDSDVTAARVTLANMDVLGKTVDYSTYLNGMGIGTTAEDRRFFEERQKELQLKNDIESNMTFIDTATVAITLGSASSYVTAIERPAKASITVGVTGGGKLSNSQAQTIIELVAGSVSGLTTDSVTLADTRGYLYSLGGSDEDTEGVLAGQLAITEQTRSAMERQLTNLFIPVVGNDNVEVAVSVELDFDETTIDSIEFAPPVEGSEEGLIVSLYQLWENTREGLDAEGVPGSDSNGIGTVEYPYTDMDEDDYYRKYINEINYEINQTRTTITRAKGTIKTLSVGIMLNSNVISEEYLDGFATVAASALGIDQRYVTVYSVPFIAADSTIGSGNNGEEEVVYDVISLAIKAFVVLLLGLALIVLLYQLFKRPAPAPAPQLTLVESTGVEYVADGEIDPEDFDEDYDDEDEPEREVIPVPEPEPELVPEPEPELLSLAEMEAAAKSEGVLQLEKYIDKDPAAVAQLLRNWIAD